MPEPPPKGPPLRALILIAIASSIPALAFSQILSVHPFDSRDGFATVRVNSILQSRSGYVWLATTDGLCCFDGYRFTTYGAADGLRIPNVSSVAEDHLGRLWLASFGWGVTRFSEDPKEIAHLGGRFAHFEVGSNRRSNTTYDVRFDHEDSLWAISAGGLFRASPTPGGDAHFHAIVANDSLSTFCIDRRDRVWYADDHHLFEWQSGHAVQHSYPPLRAFEIVEYIEPGEGDSLWVATTTHFFSFLPAGSSRARDVWREIRLPFPPSTGMRGIEPDGRGGLWIATTRGLAYLKGGGAVTFQSGQGFEDEDILTLGHDREGDLWMASRSGKLGRFPRDAALGIATAKNTPIRNALFTVEGRDRRRYLLTAADGTFEIVENRAVPIPASKDIPALWAPPVQDAHNNWWLVSGYAVWRCAGPELQFQRHERFKDGILDTIPLAISYFPSTDQIWAGGDHHIQWANRPENASVQFSNLSMPHNQIIEAIHYILRDREGTVWLGASIGLARVLGDSVTEILPQPGLPDTRIHGLLQDSRGWVWAALRYNGVSVTKDPEAAHPSFTNYSVKDGLSSSAVFSLAEDATGGIWLGTGHGLDRLDPLTGHVRHVTTEDGLAGEVVSDVSIDRQGMLWLSTTEGVSRLDPSRLSARDRAPPVYWSGVEVAGDPLPVPDRGVSRLPPFRVPADKNSVSLQYVGVEARNAESLRYQYSLDRAGKIWSPPTTERSLNLAHLAPGKYALRVRAITADGTASDSPAEMDFRVSPPWWLDPWVILLVALAGAASAVSLHRYRVGRILAMERLRRQIALDLHDEMGSGLSQIAILSEVAKRRAPDAEQPRLDQVADLARSLRDSMSDIVWAVDPRRDRLADLVQRMRQVTFNLFDGNGTQVRFQAPEGPLFEQISLAPDRRRQLLLAFKEAATNVARHASAKTVSTTVVVENGDLTLTVEDDGVGFDPSQPVEGRGLVSLVQRARDLGARIEIRSVPGGGTRVCLHVPLRAPTSRTRMNG